MPRPWTIVIVVSTFVALVVAGIIFFSLDVPLPFIDARLDGSSEEELKRSIDRAKAGMTDGKRCEFEESMGVIALGAAFRW